MSNIPHGITRDHILAAMKQVEADGWAKKLNSTDYDVIDPQNGSRLPPKVVMSTAVRIATGRTLSHRDFHGGPETNDRLSALGFRIAPKGEK